MTKELARRIDPIKASIEHLLVLSFGKSTSQAYPIAVNIAQGASCYEEVTIGNKLVHFAVFSKAREGAARARARLAMYQTGKARRFLQEGKSFRGSGTLQTYLSAILKRLHVMIGQHIVTA